MYKAQVMPDGSMELQGQFGKYKISDDAGGGFRAAPVFDTFVGGELPYRKRERMGYSVQDALRDECLFAKVREGAAVEHHAGADV